MTENLVDVKKRIRQQMLRIRKNMPAEMRKAADAAITQGVLQHPDFLAAKQIFAYVALPYEVPTREIIEKALEMGKIVALPVCSVGTHTLTFYRLHSMDELRVGEYRIPIPPVTEEGICQPDEETLMILPMTAFDKQGYRLGAGGGYYDRYLAAHPALKNLGVCYAECSLGEMPRDAFDRRMQACVTEQRTEEFHA